MIRYFVLALLVTPLAISKSCIHLPNLALSPSALTFSPQLINPGGGSSAPQTVTLTNSGQANLLIGKIESSGDFSVENIDCPISTNIAPGASCHVQVTFSPNVIGNILGAVTITDNTIGKPHVLPLSGAGLSPVGFSPASLDFGTVAVNTTSTAQTVTVTNNENVPLNISGVSASGDYLAVPNNCSSLQAGKTCTIAVSFHPTSTGTIPGALTLLTDAALGTQPLGLTGAGAGSVASNVVLPPTSLAFGNHEAGTTSSGKTVTLTNTGSTSLSIQNIGVSGGYQKSSDTCGTLVSGGGSCTITVKFQPSANFANVSYPGAITITDSDPTSPQIVGLSGTGAQPITSSPALVGFGTIDPNTTATDQSVTITNNHNAAEDVSITTSGHFDLSSNGCTQSLASGAHCSARVGFTSPYQAGVNSGAMTVSGSSGGFLMPAVVGLTACATPVAVFPRSFNFGAVAVGAASDPESTTITNTGSDLKISGIAITGIDSGDFAISNNTCSAALPSNGTCSLEITYKPSTSGTRSAGLSISDDGACSPQQQILNGGSSTGPFTVFVNLNEVTGSGAITSTPPGINCGGGGSACVASFATGTTVTLQPNPTSAFRLSWSGACTGTSSCTLSMDSDKQVTATINRNPELIVSISGTGGGSVTSDPPGITCVTPVTSNTNCVADFPVGAIVTLTAAPGSTSRFAGWSGGGCSGTGKCSFTSNSDQTITATFTSTAPDFSLSASSAAPSTVPAGKGAASTVTLSSVNGFSSPVALTCSVDPSPALAPTCSLNPSSATLAANGSANATLTISTTAPTTASAAPSAVFFYALSLPLAGIASLSFDLSSRKRKILLRQWLFYSVLAAGIALVASCGGGSSTTTTQKRVGGTPTGHYTITVTGTAGSTQHSVTTALMVQ